MEELSYANLLDLLPPIHSAKEVYDSMLRLIRALGRAPRPRYDN
jgi:hypothetical protein